MYHLETFDTSRRLLLSTRGNHLILKSGYHTRYLIERGKNTLNKFRSHVIDRFNIIS